MFEDQEEEQIDMSTNTSQSDAKQSVLEIIKAIHALHRSGKAHGNLSTHSFDRGTSGRSGGNLQIVSNFEDAAFLILVYLMDLLVNFRLNV